MQTNLTASKEAKKTGYKSLQQVANIVGTSRENLINWHRDKPRLFRCILLGACQLKSVDD